MCKNLADKVLNAIQHFPEPLQVRHQAYVGLSRDLRRDAADQGRYDHHRRAADPLGPHHLAHGAATEADTEHDVGQLADAGKLLGPGEVIYHQVTQVAVFLTLVSLLLDACAAAGYQPDDLWASSTAIDLRCPKADAPVRDDDQFVASPGQLCGCLYCASLVGFSFQARRCCYFWDIRRADDSYFHFPFPSDSVVNHFWPSRLTPLPNPASVCPA